MRGEARGMKTRRGYKDTGKKIYQMKGKIETRGEADREKHEQIITENRKLYRSKHK